MKTLTDYIIGVRQNYKYKIKFAFDLDDKKFEATERALCKYDIVKVGSITRSPIEKNPIDFPTISISEVYTIDIETTIPMSSTVTQQEIASYTKIPVDRILVCDENVNYKDYDLAIIASQEEKYLPKVLDPNYETDGTPSIDVHGENHNEELVKTVVDSIKENPWDTALKKFKIGDWK